MNSIKLTYAEYDKFRFERDPESKAPKPMTERINAAGVDTEVEGFTISFKEHGVILSNENPVKMSEWLESIKVSPVIRETNVDKTEVMNIFNELLDEWYKSDEHVIENLGNHSDFIENDRNELRGKKADYIKRFKKALGVE